MKRVHLIATTAELEDGKRWRKRPSGAARRRSAELGRAAIRRLIVLVKRAPNLNL